jgi:Trypsin
MPKSTKAGALAAVIAAVLVCATGAQAIVNGQPDGSGHPYVGFLVTFENGRVTGACSGSLIADGVFLTAGHCTAGSDTARIWFDEEWDGSLATFDVVGTPHTYPGFCLGCAGGLPGADRGDVGVVTFSAGSGNVPSRHAALPAAGAVDTLKNKAALDYVGYGDTFQAKIPGSLLPQPPPFFRWDGLGTRMVASGELVSGNFTNSDQFLKLSQNPSQGKGGGCFGDSGGPVLRGGTSTVLGVNVFGPNSNCAGVGYAQRVDVPEILAWIDSFVQ